MFVCTFIIYPTALHMRGCTGSLIIADQTQKLNAYFSWLPYCCFALKYLKWGVFFKIYYYIKFSNSTFNGVNVGSISKVRAAVSVLVLLMAKN